MMSVEGILTLTKYLNEKPHGIKKFGIRRTECFVVLLAENFQYICWILQLCYRVGTGLKPL